MLCCVVPCCAVGACRGPTRSPLTCATAPRWKGTWRGTTRRATTGRGGAADDDSRPQTSAARHYPCDLPFPAGKSHNPHPSPPSSNPRSITRTLFEHSSNTHPPQVFKWNAYMRKLLHNHPRIGLTPFYDLTALMPNMHEEIVCALEAKHRTCCDCTHVRLFCVASL